MSDIKLDVIQAVKERMHSNGHNLDDFAETIDESISTVNNWITCGNFPRALRAQKVLRYLAEDVTELAVFESASFGDKLFLMRVREGMTIAEASSAMGISHVSLRNWEKNKKFPTDGQLRKILSFYNIDGDDLGVEVKEETFGQRLQDERLMLGYTQDYVARQVGISTARLSRYESDMQIPGLRVLQNLMHVVGDEYGTLFMSESGEPLKGFETHYEILATGKEACHQ